MIGFPPQLDAVRFGLLPAVNLLIKFEIPPQIWYRSGSYPMECVADQLSVFLALGIPDVTLS